MTPVDPEFVGSNSKGRQNAERGYLVAAILSFLVLVPHPEDCTEA